MNSLSILSRSRLRAIALVVVALLVASCGQPSNDDTGASPTNDTEADTPASDDDDDEGDEGDDAEDGVDAMAFTDCEADRYTVGYPQDWNTNADDELLGPCEIFHPGDIDAPERPRDRDLHYAVSMYVDDVEFEDGAPDDSEQEVLEERETTVDGHRARVFEYRSSGEALTPEGEHSYTWIIDLDGQILVATTSSVGDTDYERDKQVLDRMVAEELTLHDDTEMIDGPSTTDRSTQEPDGSVVLTDVSVGAHDGFDRVVFEFDVTGDGDAGWLIEYDDDPRSQGRGDPVEVEGDAVLRVALRHVPYPTDAPVEGYDGPERIQPERTDAIVEVVEDVLYEGYQDFFIGLDSERPYRVERLTDPQRIVIDIETD